MHEIAYDITKHFPFKDPENLATGKCHYLLLIKISGSRPEVAVKGSLMTFQRQINQRRVRPMCQKSFRYNKRRSCENGRM